MLHIRTIKNPLITDTSKDKYCFRSICSQNLTLNKLASEMSDYNSSFTEADNLGMLSILNTVVTKYLAKGYSIELPFGIIRANVTGTCSGIQDGFTLGTGNNHLGFLFNINSNTEEQVRSTLEYKQLPPDVSGEVKIYRITTLQDDASESENLNISTGKTIRLHGRKLSFDISDTLQGVFLENSEEQIRIKSFTRRGTNIVDFVIPSDLPIGKYTLSIVTKPGNTYFTAKTTSQITIN